MSKTLLFWVFFGKATFLSTLLSKFFNNDLFWVTFLSKFTFLSPFLSIFEKNYFFEHFFEHSFGSFFGVWVFFWALFWAGSTWALFWVLFWALFWAMTSWALFWVLFWVDFWGSKAYETFMPPPTPPPPIIGFMRNFTTITYLCCSLLCISSFDRTFLHQPHSIWKSHVFSNTIWPLSLSSDFGTRSCTHTDTASYAFLSISDSNAKIRFPGRWLLLVENVF